MTMYKPLNEYLRTHESLMHRLQSPLKETQVFGKGLIPSENMPGVAEGEQLFDGPEDLLSEGAIRDPSWQFADEMCDSE